MLGNKLKLLRISKNLTQKQISIDLNLSEARYNQYESNRRSPDYNTLKDISKFFKVSIDFLLDNESDENKDLTEIKELETFRKILIKAGYITQSEYISTEEYNDIIKFIVQNKNFIKRQ